ncbi:MAG: ATP-binding cassette domain-containing protein [Bacteroidales bacterium]|nr:ATP-binding cassette domain-containing protein [Bacteroidales bacterium]
MSKELEIKGLHKAFGNMTVFRDFSLTFPVGQITCILGPSGCGKTTLLNMIGGITQPDSGSITGFESKTISYIFQDPRLLPWKTVEENIAFVLNQNLPEAEKKKITGRFIRLVDLEGFTDYYPAKLSGGMRQRVSIARAFAYPSDIILMDEPLKGLDVKLKYNLIRTFSRIWKSDRRTVVFVTHDVDEAILMGHEIVVMSQAPVKLLEQIRLQQPVENRETDDPFIRELKLRLFQSMGML